MNEDFLKLQGSEHSQRKEFDVVRNVGHLMTTPTVLDQNDEEVFEGFLMRCTVTIALHDVRREEEIPPVVQFMEEAQNAWARGSGICAEPLVCGGNTWSALKYCKNRDNG